MALALFVVGRIAEFYPRARDDLTAGITAAFPGIIGTGEQQISLDDVQRLAATLGWIGLAGALLTGLGWMSAMRTALLDVFEVPQDAKPDFVFGKIRDLVTLPVLGLTLAVSVALSSLVARFSTQLLEWLALSEGLAPLLRVLSVVVGVATSTLLFWAMYVLLGRPRTPRRSLWQGALLAAFAFEILKFLAAWLLGHTAGQPAFQIFGIALIVVIWINYFARIALYGAAWAHTTRRARDRRAAAEPVESRRPRRRGGRRSRRGAPTPGDTDALRRRVEAARADPERRREIAAAAAGSPMSRPRCGVVPAPCPPSPPAWARPLPSSPCSGGAPAVGDVRHVTVGPVAAACAPVRRVGVARVVRHSATSQAQQTPQRRRSPLPGRSGG